MRPERLYSAYVFDMDGTIYLGDDVLPGVHEGLRVLRERDIPVRFLSNNPTKDPELYAAKLSRAACPPLWTTSPTPWSPRFAGCWHTILMPWCSRSPSSHSSEP